MNGTNNLFVGGQFSSVDGSSILANNIASWDGNSWNYLGSNSTNNGALGGTYPFVSVFLLAQENGSAHLESSR